MLLRSLYGSDCPSIGGLILFYLLVLRIGIWASIKTKRDELRMRAHPADIALSGDRKITLVIGIFTRTGEFVYTNVFKEKAIVCQR